MRELCGMGGLAVRAKLLEILVDLEGFEPSTSSMPWKRAPNCATGPSEGLLFLEYHGLAGPFTRREGVR